MVIAIDTIDKETWSDKNGNADYRINLHEAWMRYITNEVVPFIQHIAMERNGWHEAPGIMTFGCSLGATHAVNLFYRFPQHFDSMMALSGIYTAEYGFGSYMNGQIYENSPVHYLDQMPYHHPYVQMYNRGRSVICVGQGAWEQPETTRKLDEIFKRNGINTWVDYWGSDVNHDWPWWYKQVVHYLPWLLYQR
jgi:esterase/lipase superfamily enzyme